MVVDGVAGKLYEEIAFDEVSFSPNSARVANVATDRGYSFAVVDDQEGQKQRRATEIAQPVFPPVFSPNAKHVGTGSLTRSFLHGD